MNDLALKPVQQRPFNAEAPLPALTEIPTPTRLFYVRSNFDVPHIDAAAWRLRVTGAVAREREFTFEELGRFAPSEAVVLLECAGNGRRHMVPLPSGVAWDVGAVSCAHFSGISLAAVLKECGVSSDAVEVLFIGADSGEVEPGRHISFERSLPIDAAMSGAVSLVTRMNGEPLPIEHGFPMRVLVPRWYAVSSVKWLTEIRVIKEPFTGHFQAERYVYIQDPIAPDHTPVREMRVRALIAQPADGSSVHAGNVLIRGLAWSGAGAISAVDVSADGGVSWQPAELGTPLGEAAPTPWSFSWDAPAGEHTLRVRARDDAGNEQPLESIYNQLGYGNNVVQAISVRAE